MKKVISVILALSFIVCLFSLTTVAADGENKVGLEWMRSREDTGYILPVSGDDWSYEQAIKKTPLQYFQTDAIKNAAQSEAADNAEWIYGNGLKVGKSYIWDNGTVFDKYKEENGNVSYDWASWNHPGTDAMPGTTDGEYSLRRFSTYVNVSQSTYNKMTSAILAPTDELGNMSYLFPINDTVFIFVNGHLAFWGGTDIVEGKNQYGALQRTSFNGLKGIPVRNGVNGALKDVYPHTDGWCIDLEYSKDYVDVKNLLQPGFNRIDVFADDFWEGGGMNKLDLYFKSELNSAKILKTVNGVDINKWISDNGYNAAEVAASMSFVAENMETGAKHNGSINTTTGEIIFTPALVPGDYKVTEELTNTSSMFSVEGAQNITIDGEMNATTTNRYISDATYGSVIKANEGDNGQVWNLPDVWNTRLAGQPAFEKLKRMGAKWIWNEENTYQFGITGGIFETKIDIYAENNTAVPFYFAVDNVAAVYVNGKLAFCTDVAMDGRSLSQDYSPTVFGELNFNNFDGRWDEGWAHAYEKTLYLSQGKNEIIIIAANSAKADHGENASYNTTNNPCGIIFGFEIKSTTFNNRLTFTPPETPVE